MTVLSTPTPTPVCGLTPRGGVAPGGFTPAFVGVCAALCAVAGWGAFAYSRQVAQGLAVTGMNDTVSWGLYMVDLIFLMGIGHAGTLFSAWARLSGRGAGHPALRIAEVLPVVTVAVGAQFAPLDLGRPERAHFVFLHARLQSPIVWDAVAINIYLLGSVIYLFATVLPDLATVARAGGVPGWKRSVCGVLSLGYRGTPSQAARLRLATTVMAVTLIPVSIGAESVLALVFANAQRPGWHSALVAPTFVVGACVTGTAVILLTLVLVRAVYGLRAEVGWEQVRPLSRILAGCLAVYGYLACIEHVAGAYHAGVAEGRWSDAILWGGYAGAFWLTMAAGVVVPFLLLAVPGAGRMARAVIACVCVVVGGYFKRLLFVVPALAYPLVPGAHAQAAYRPTWVEWSVTGGAFALVVLAVMLLSRFVPLVPPASGREGGAA